MNIVAIIPERMGAGRFPGKPLAKICGTPMVEHIYSRTKLAKEIDGVYVASPDMEVLEYVRSIGGDGGLEKTPSRNAPTTITCALAEIEEKFGSPIDWIIMVQGDEPMITPGTIDSLALFIRNHPELKIVNIIDDIREEKEYSDQNIVKIVLNQEGRGMWFFRTPSERWSKDLASLPIKKQTGIIAFKKDFLLSFGAGEKTPLEKMESVDMFRLIEQGETIPVVLSHTPLYSVDTPQDLAVVEKYMSSDPLVQTYER